MSDKTERVDLKRRYHVAGKRFDATVRVMSVAEGWAMCRYRGCTPFVCRVDELSPADE